MKKYTKIQEAKYYAVLLAGTFLFTAAVLSAGKLLAILLNTTL